MISEGQELCGAMLNKATEQCSAALCGCQGTSQAVVTVATTNCTNKLTVTRWQVYNFLSESSKAILLSISFGLLLSLKDWTVQIS